MYKYKNEKWLEDNKFYSKYKETVDAFNVFRENALPLCAAENIISEFSKRPLMYGLQERYILGGYLNYDEEENMIGSKKLLPFYEIVADQCKKMFNAYYTDCRSLSGMNAMQNILMALVKRDDTLLILSSESGGHAALPNILDKLGINYIEVIFNYKDIDYDYNYINEILDKNNINSILFAPSDIIFFPDFKKINVPENTILIFDASQVMAFYINNQEKNPLYMKYKVILMGGTHKTIPGVAKALIMTNNEAVAKKIDDTINPLYLRNTHLQNVASLILTLIEMEYYAEEYCKNMKNNSNYLGKKLSEYGMDVINRNGKFSETHQLFIHLEKNDLNRVYSTACELGVTLNKKNKKLFRGYGIRLGVQEVTRYGWDYKEMDLIAEILYLIYINELDNIPSLIAKLIENKEIKYTFDEVK